MGWPGEQLIIRMWETLSEKGVGSLLRPWQIKRDGIANIEVRRAELLALAQAEKDAESIRNGLKQLSDFSTDLKFSATPCTPSVTKARTEPIIDLPAIIEVATRQTVEDSVRRQINVAHAIFHAEETLRDDNQELPSKNIDGDWLYRWRDYASDVSNESMQSLWGQILAGEVKNPGSISLRALDFLRNLSQDEAKTIEYLSQFAIEGIIWRDDALDVSFAILLAMQDLGVISGVDSAGLTWIWTSSSTSNFVKALTSNGKVIIIKHDDPNKKLSLPVYVLTGIGNQLLKLGKFTPNVEYLEQFGKAIQKEGFSVYLADITHIVGGMIHVANERPIEVQPDIQAN
ncbi:DUF2806 domain-containing protein [Aeromonas veronii]|uniref:DUF2806 domain-containing protein n=1 Tax=Aeromonas veronii TaxID=654 RepID=UPI001BCC4BF2|nr:DUF2806 domain-containing protein [Aeromonas veronii]MBS4702819.1 DUF2806 domain-containing protein [Aeromonas veronii]